MEKKKKENSEEITILPACPITIEQLAISVDREGILENTLM
jgi:hypothetical protein